MKGRESCKRLHENLSTSPYFHSPRTIRESAHIVSGGHREKRVKKKQRKYGFLFYDFIGEEARRISPSSMAL